VFSALNCLERIIKILDEITVLKIQGKLLYEGQMYGDCTIKFQV